MEDTGCGVGFVGGIIFMAFLVAVGLWVYFTTRDPRGGRPPRPGGPGGGDGGEHPGDDGDPGDR